MKRLIAILSLVFTCVSQAALNDAYSMVQISRGTWRVQCQDQRIMQVSTREILNQQLCGTTSTNPQACFDATIAGLKTFEFDELNEIQEINRACAQGDRYTADCVTSAKSGLKSFEYDDRSEGIEIVQACTQGIRRGRNNTTLVQCMASSTRGLKSFEFDDREEIIEIVIACAMGNRQTFQCVDRTTASLRSFDFDDLEEILEIIRSCY